MILLQKWNGYEFTIKSIENDFIIKINWKQFYSKNALEMILP